MVYNPEPFEEVALYERKPSIQNDKLGTTENWRLGYYSAGKGSKNEIFHFAYLSKYIKIYVYAVKLIFPRLWGIPAGCWLKTLQSLV